jgi:aminomethyltransferase
VWQALTDAGGDRVRPCGLAARDSLRLEAGMPLYGNELSLDTTPFDVGAARLVKADGPDHVGRAALLASADGPHQQLVGLHVDGRRPARAGYAVRFDGADIGVITSGALSPTLGHPIAIARVGAELTAGSQVTIDVRGSEVAATVIDLPFYQRS